MSMAALIEKKAAAPAQPSSAWAEVVELQCSVQHYAWGDRRFIPALIGLTDLQAKPCAELWMGTHPDAPSRVVLHGETVLLKDWIGLDPNRVLHPSVAARFERQLPFRYKVLAAASSLSLQVHPCKENAEAGFARENAAGLPAGSPLRNYRDANHKPELLVALTDFYGLRGFRELRDIADALEAVPELRDFAADFKPEPKSLAKLYSKFMSATRKQVDEILGDLVRRIECEHLRWPFTEDDWEYWLLRANCEHSRGGHYDRGLFSFPFLNLVHLKPGEGMFLPGGILHAYLAGAGVEVMANSNNVLRGGLTPKHVDVPELLRNVLFEGGDPEIIHAQRVAKTSERTYATAAEEFALSRIELAGGRPHTCHKDHAFEIFIVISATESVRVKTGSGSESFERGQVFLVTAGTHYELSSDRPATLFKATVPLPTETTGAAATLAAGSLSFRGRRPVELAFGTSGLRGLVKDITDLEAYINTRGFLDYLCESNEVQVGDSVCLATDLRPSSDSPDRSIARAVALAIEDAGFQVEHLGPVPTPALAHYALRRCHASIMVTGSHIPFDRNGIKFYKPTGEVLKSDEAGILQAVQRVRKIEYARSTSRSLFADDGMFQPGAIINNAKTNSRARREYTLRYLDFLSENCLQGLRVVFYQHSSVARDLLPELLISLGAQVIPRGRSETFVPVDTEAVSADKLATLQHFVDDARQTHGPIDAIVSTDGDGDRPLVAGVDANGKVCFITGDILGIMVAEFLGADVVAVPISVNDAVDRWAAMRGVSVFKTKIGSPYVIETMLHARTGGSLRVVGWEANGGFLTATDITRNCRTLTALPTRDAALPILAALCSAKERNLSPAELLALLSHRFGQSGLIDAFPSQTSGALLRRFTPREGDIVQVEFGDTIRAHLADGTAGTATAELASSLLSIRQDFERFFRPADGFDGIARVNFLDGVRVQFRNGDIAHIRPSGNAPQLRVYACADSQARADAIVAHAIREPDGILRQIELEVSPPATRAGYVEGIRKNIALTTELLARGETPEVIGTVSGSAAAQAFWQDILDRARESFKARATLSFQEDLPTNQALGILLLWQRLKPQVREDGGALVAFVFGDGTRSTPFTETDNAQKPAMATFVRETSERGSRFLSMVELGLRHFIPVQQFLRRSGFRGLVVKWGDEVQIPTCELSGTNAKFRDADIVRFVSLRELTDDEARNKDWVGVNAEGRVTAFIPRRPLAQMGPLAERGLLQQRDGKLYGGVNLGSIAISLAFLDCLLAEFGEEVNDRTADRARRPALDPEFFTALTVAAINCAEEREKAWAVAKAESAEVAALDRHVPGLLARLRRTIQNLEAQEKREFKMVAMDFGDQFWGDIGQHTKIHEFFMALIRDDETGQIARAIAGLPGQANEHGNLIVNSTVSPLVRVMDSVLINVQLSGRGTVERSVLIGTRAGNVEICDGFDVLSTVTDLRIEPRGATYKAVSDVPVHAAPGERVTTLFLPTLGARLFRVNEDTNLRDKTATYVVPILGNPLSFQQAHVEMGAQAAGVVERTRKAAEAAVLASLTTMH